MTGAGRSQPSSEPSLLMRGMALRSSITDCPYGAFKVYVSSCNGKGECADICAVGVFTRSSRGECTVLNDVLCFGCMACVAQCTEGGVHVFPDEREGRLTAEEILR
jgi:ferredoxin